MPKIQKNDKKKDIEKTEKILFDPVLEDTVEVTDEVTTGVTSGVTPGVTDNLLPFTQLRKDLEISRKTAYNRMNFLQITPWKIDGKIYLDEVQVGYMNDLQEHYKQHGNFEGFPIPDPSGPWEEIKTETESSTTSALTKAEPTILTAEGKTEKLTFSTEVSGQDQLESLVELRDSNQANSDLEEVDQHSQYRAATRIIAGETLTLAYEATGEFTIPGLKDQVEAHKQRCQTARSKGTGNYNLDNFLSKKMPHLIGNNG